MQWKLKNVQSGDIVEISKSLFTVGRRQDADLGLKNTVISRNHAVLSVLIDGSLIIKDSKSENGTFVNNKKLSCQDLEILKAGDIIHFGTHEKWVNSYQPSLCFQVIIENATNNAVLENPVEQCLKDKCDDKPVKCEAVPQTENPQNNVQPESVLLYEDYPKKLNEPNKIFPQSGLILRNNDKSDCVFSKMDDNCIIISDDEDNSNDPFQSGQIFQLSQHIKSEAPFHESGVDPFAHIKEEINELDYLEDYVLNIDLTVPDHGFDNTCDLLSVLDNGNESDNNSKKGDAGIELDDNFESKTATNETAAENICKKKKEDGSNKLNDTEKKKVQSKYLKPPIIEPHEQSKSISKVDEKKEQPTPKKLKRKQTETTTTVKKPKVCDNATVNKALKDFSKRKNVHSDYERKSKALIVTERKKKLKEISEKNTKDMECSLKEKKSPAKVKVSDGRGSFLLQTNQVGKQASASTSKSAVDSALNLLSTSKLSRNKTSNSIPDGKNAILKKGETIQDTTVSTNWSPMQVVPVEPQPSTSYAVAEAGFPVSPESTSIENRSGLIWQNVGSLTRPQVNRNIMENNCDSIKREITKMLHWSVSWLMEQKEYNLSPPVNGEDDPKSLQLRYKSFAEYNEVMSSLLLMEMWEFIFQSFFNKSEEKAPMKVLVNQARVLNPLLYLDCECYLSEENLSSRNTIQMHHFMLIEMILKDLQDNCWYNYTAFGFVSECTSSNLRNTTYIAEKIAKMCSGIPKVNVKFTIVTRNPKGKDLFSLKPIIIKVIAHIGAHCKLLKTLKHVGKSPMCKLILDPNVSDYQKPRDSNKLVVEIKLNELQKEIVLEASNVCLKNEAGMYLIKGPPGTGKSTVIVNIVMQILLCKARKRNRQPLVLLTAPSNAAIDGLVQKISEARLKLPENHKKMIKLVRIGPDTSINRKAVKYSVNYMIGQNMLRDHNLMNTEDYRNFSMKGGRDDIFLKHRLGESYHYNHRCTEEKLMSNATIICTTLNSSVSSQMMFYLRKGKLHFTCCIIDEATQCTEAEALLPVSMGINKFVLVGDPQQLPAVINNREARELGLEQSLLSRLDQTLNFSGATQVKMLCDQYRMKDDICQYPNRKYYGGKLNSFPLHLNKITPPIKPYLLFNLSRSDADYEEDRSAYVNSEEVAFIVELLKTLRGEITSKCNYSIGIITTYRAQKELLLQKASKLKMNPEVSLTVNTIDSFQGAENDIIIVSCVRYSPNYFLQNEKRLNVALTRARQALYVVGNYDLFKKCRLLYDLREDAKGRKLCVDLKSDSKASKLRQFIRYDT